MGALTGRTLHGATVAFALGILAGSAGAKRVGAAQLSACTIYAPEAAARSGLPVEIITHVMLAESNGDPRAVSPKGALGCMQIMPATWTYLTARYALGSDPFDPRQNMIGGALYLAELKQQFGFPGAFAAYNAGAARYVRFVATGRALPAETVAYVGRLGGAAPAAPVALVPARWEEAALFLVRGEGAHVAEQAIAQAPTSPSTVPGSAPAPIAPARPLPARSTLFPLAGSGQERSN